MQEQFLILTGKDEQAFVEHIFKQEPSDSISKKFNHLSQRSFGLSGGYERKEDIQWDKIEKLQRGVRRERGEIQLLLSCNLCYISSFYYLEWYIDKFIINVFICYLGIQLSKGFGHLDFSNRNTFYVSKSLKASLDWCLRRHANKDWGIVVFEVEKDWASNDILSLKEDNTWRTVVKYYRNVLTQQSKQENEKNKEAKSKEDKEIDLDKFMEDNEGSTDEDDNELKIVCLCVFNLI